MRHENIDFIDPEIAQKFVSPGYETMVLLVGRGWCKLRLSELFPTVRKAPAGAVIVRPSGLVVFCPGGGTTRTQAARYLAAALKDC